MINNIADKLARVDELMTGVSAYESYFEGHPEGFVEVEGEAPLVLYLLLEILAEHNLGDIDYEILAAVAQRLSRLAAQCTC